MPFCIVGGHSQRLRLLLAVTRLIVIVECFCYRGHPDADLVYIIIAGHMDVSDGPFNKPLLGEKKNIRFTPTNSSNVILVAHSCGLGGKYQYKHTKVSQIGHLKRLVQCGRTFIFSFWLAVTDLLMTVRQRLFLDQISNLQLDLIYHKPACISPRCLGFCSGLQ